MLGSDRKPPRRDTSVGSPHRDRYILPSEVSDPDPGPRRRHQRIAARFIYVECNSDGLSLRRGKSKPTQLQVQSEK